EGDGSRVSLRPFPAALEHASRSGRNRTGLKKESQIPRQSLCRGVAILDLVFHAFQTNSLKITRHAGSQVTRWLRGLASHSMKKFHRRVALKRPPPRQALVEDDPQRPDVRRRPRSRIFTPRLFRCHEGGCPDYRTKLLRNGLIGQLGKRET